MKKLLLTLALVLFCSTALAGIHPVDFPELVEDGKDMTVWLESPKTRSELIQKVTALVEKDPAFANYSGFLLGDAINNSCAGLDADGKLFVAMLNEKNGIMLRVTLDPATGSGTFTVKSDSREDYDVCLAASGMKGDVVVYQAACQQLEKLASYSIPFKKMTTTEQMHEIIYQRWGENWKSSDYNMAVLVLYNARGLWQHPDYDQSMGKISFDLEHFYLMEQWEAPGLLTTMMYTGNENAQFAEVIEYNVYTHAATARVYRLDGKLTLARVAGMYDSVRKLDPEEVQKLYRQLIR